MLDHSHLPRLSTLGAYWESYLDSRPPIISLCTCYLQSVYSVLTYISILFHLISFQHLHFYRSPCVETPTAQHSEAPLPSYSLEALTRARILQMHHCPRHQNQYPHSHHHRRLPQCHHTLFSSATRMQQRPKQEQSSEHRMQRHITHLKSVEMSICALSELILSCQSFNGQNAYSLYQEIRRSLYYITIHLSASPVPLEYGTGQELRHSESDGDRVRAARKAGLGRLGQGCHWPTGDCPRARGFDPGNWSGGIQLKWRASIIYIHTS